MRRKPVVNLPRAENRELARVVDALHQTIGFVVPLLVVPVLMDTGGFSAAAGAVAQTAHPVDWPDTGVDEFRLVGYANDGASAGLTLSYAANGVVLATAGLPQGGAADFAGDWTRLSQAGRALLYGDHSGVLSVVGSGTATLYHVMLHARTVTAA